MDVQVDSKRFGDGFVSAIDKADYQGAKQIARDAVTHFKSLLTDARIGDALLNAGLYHAVMFRGLFDYAELARLTSDAAWTDDRKTIELVWRRLCDCRDRVAFVARVSSGQIFARIFACLDKIESWFAQQFGTGVYSSPEILVKWELCSICDQDIRRCEHIASNVYHGRICYGIPQDISFESSSIVQVPHDRRCRIWPWQLKGRVVSNILLLTTFRVDDFLDMDDWGKSD